MSTKDWKNKELGSLLNEKWGFSMDLGKLNEASCGSGSRDDKKKKLEEEELEVEDGPGEGDDNMGITKSGKMVPNPGGDGKNKSKKEKDDKKDKKTKKPEKGKVPEQFKKNKKDKEKIEEMDMGITGAFKNTNPKDIESLEKMSPIDKPLMSKELSSPQQIALKSEIMRIIGPDANNEVVDRIIGAVMSMMSKGNRLEESIRKQKLKQQIRRILKNKMKRNK